MGGDVGPESDNLFDGFTVIGAIDEFDGGLETCSAIASYLD